MTKLKRRFETHFAANPENTGLSATHPAVTDARTLFPTTVVSAADAPREEDFHMCGKPPLAGRPYCPEHCSRAYVGFNRSREEAVQ